MKICFFIPGLPAPGGSKKAFFNPRANKIVVTDAAGTRNKDWKNKVSFYALLAMQGKNILTRGVKIEIIFILPRPKSHLRKNGEIKTNAPLFPIVKPDVLKLARSTEDALTGIIFKDDSQTVDLHVKKIYGDKIGAKIELEEVE